ncbi:uncharacterized protein [Nicotiana tomentosiformis]|uniref:uncharacterized protein n=1 Tax=Nicotiana tomentosiformis TaxID=4098 RepID=UPI00388C9890
MVDFDVILGIDWLSPYYTILDCHPKTTTLAMPWLLRFNKWLRREYLAYLAFVRDVTADTPTVDSVPVVREFLDVFLVDLWGMPPDRNIDFGIDLAPVELKELKEELQVLLDKVFIRPSISPWGAPVLFVKKKDVL